MRNQIRGLQRINTAIQDPGIGADLVKPRITG